MKKTRVKIVGSIFDDNFKRWIFGNEKSKNWLQVIYKEKHPFRNPVKQNRSHMYALKDILHEFPNACYFPIVVFTGSAELKRIESSDPILYESELTATIKKFSVSQCVLQTDWFVSQNIGRKNSYLFRNSLDKTAVKIVT